MSGDPVMLFDGRCVFCNGAVNFALTHEKQPILSFAALQSDAGLALSRKHGLPTADFRTFVIVRDDKAYTRYEAAVQLGYLIGGRWARLASLMDFFVPDFIGNPIYSVLWPLRKIFGVREQCMLPSPTLRARLVMGGESFSES